MSQEKKLFSNVFSIYLFVYFIFLQPSIVLFFLTFIFCHFIILQLDWIMVSLSKQSKLHFFLSLQSETNTWAVK